MNYEKLYKEALERAEEIIRYYKEHNRDEAAIEDLEVIFPELQESEDERVRKWIIGVLSTYEYDRDLRNAALAWLEKQGEKKPFDYENATIVQQDFAPKSAMEAIKEEKVDNQNCIKPADMVEPKFHEGDWVVYNNDVCQIVKREEGCNKLVTIFGIEKELVNERNLSTAHLWTIQDAKDGDVLVDVYGNIGIFEQYDDFDWVSYCSLGHNGGFQHFKIEHENENTYPATKEQRDTLFAKMYEAGYIWDSKSKQLLSLKVEPSGEHKPTWNEEDEERFQSCLTILLAKSLMGDTETINTKWLKSLKERIKGE